MSWKAHAAMTFFLDELEGTRRDDLLLELAHHEREDTLRNGLLLDELEGTRRNDLLLERAHHELACPSPPCRGFAAHARRCGVVEPRIPGACETETQVL